MSDVKRYTHKDGWGLGPNTEYVLASDYDRRTQQDRADYLIVCKQRDALKAERDLLLMAVASVGGDMDLLLTSAPGALPSSRQVKKWRDELADAWKRAQDSKGGTK